MCGYSGKRECPAKAALICPGCCGAKRGHEIDCPADCASFPFGTRAYDIWLRVDGAWAPKAFDYVLGKLGKEQFEKTAREFAPSWEEDGEDSFAEGARSALLRCLVMPMPGASLSLGEQWANEDWSGLNNDERYMARYRCRALPGLLEVQNVLDNTRIECVDILDPERGKFIVFDRSTASRANRFDTLLTWLVHYPHFSRVDGSGVHLDRNFIQQFLKEMRKRSKASLRDDSDMAVRRHLACNYGEAFELIASLGREMQENILSTLDVHHCRAYYRIKSSQTEIAAILDNKPDFSPDEDREAEPDDPPGSQYYSWMRLGEAKRLERYMPSVFRHKTPEDGIGSLGTVRLSTDEFMLETFTRQKFDFAKKLLKKYFGRDLAFLKEEVINLAQQAFERSQDPTREPEEPSQSTVPPEVEKQLIEQFHRRHYEKFLDETVPMLKGLTPRQAAADPKNRPLLIDLMKLHMRNLDDQSRKQGVRLEIDWVLNELGLHELL